MSTITFKALIDGVHFDPKKGVVKIQLIAGSHVSIDKLVRLGPGDENITVVLQSPQTEIDVFPLVPDASVGGGPITIDEEGAKKLEEAARKLRDVTDNKEEEPEDDEKWLEHDETLEPEPEAEPEREEGE
ncbi:hypothetical protein [ANMV-1 virus]|nr:hypothetical protein [ANMV-1 virus]